MYFQFLIEDKSTNILVNHVMEKMVNQYTKTEIIWDIKFFGGIGHLKHLVKCCRIWNMLY